MDIIRIRMPEMHPTLGRIFARFPPSGNPDWRHESDRQMMSLFHSWPTEAVSEASIGAREARLAHATDKSLNVHSMIVEPACSLLRCAQAGAVDTADGREAAA